MASDAKLTATQSAAKAAGPSREQALRARVAALDAARSLRNDYPSAAAMLAEAEDFEAWLLRPLDENGVAPQS